MEPDPKLRAALEPAWNDLREQRVLGRIVEARRHRTAYRRPLAVALVVAAACACAAIAFASWRRPSRPARGPELATAPAPGGEPSSRMTLADGSEAFLGLDGNVQVEEQAPARVRLRQTAGAVRYVVVPDAAREFVVRAEGVVVRVRGTIFSVTVRPETVEVAVERGRVEVAGGERTRDLVAGEAFRVPLHPAADDGRADGASAASPAEPPAPAAGTPSPATAAEGGALLARADEARAAGNQAEAAVALEAFASTYPRDARLPAALFTLGRVERARGRPDAAAAAFERCQSTLPHGPLADDALAEAAQSWSAAGATDRARADANAYLAAHAAHAAHPGGIHTAAMRALSSR